MKVRYSKTKFSPVIQAAIRDKFGLSEERVIFKYVRNNKRQKVGICVALANGRAGWSRCAYNKHDSFDRPIGYELALKRAITNTIDQREEPVPDDVNVVLKYLKWRAKIYFKESPTQIHK